jgi:uncharacterized protein
MKARYASILMIICMVSIILSGCATGTKHISRFYVLNALGNAQKAGTAACRDARIITIGISPVNLPKYLDRPQIMTRINDNQYKLSELHQWAEPLKDNVSRVLAQNLRELLCADIKMYPWTGSEQIDYRLSAKLVRLDGTPGGEASLHVQWTVYDQKTEKLIYTKESRFTEPVGASSYDSLVSAYSRLLDSFSKELADSFTSISPSKSIP